MSIISEVLRMMREAGRPAVDVAAAGRAALDEMEQAWREDIYDPSVRDHSADGERCRAWIDRAIRGPDGIGWSWDAPYEGDGHGREWCGVTVAYAWRRYIPLRTRYTFFASTSRLLCWGQGRPWERVTNPKLPGRLCVALDEYMERLPDGLVPQPGDILLSGGIPGGKRKREGQHVEMVESYADGVFNVIGGNAGGFGPNHERQQGVTKSTRQLGLRPMQRPETYHARWLIRPAPADLVG